MDIYTFNESLLISSFFKFLRVNNGLMIDVGAHVGSSLTPFALLGWKVLALEAEKSNYNELCSNMEKLPNVDCINTLVSNINGTRKFYISSKHWGIHSIQPFHETHIQSVNLESITLAKLIKDKNIKHVNFLKIDVEGADYLVIKGFNFKRDCPNIIMCEFMDDRTIPYFKYSYKDVMEYMKKLGYLCYVFEWSKIVGGYGEKGISKHSTNFMKYYPYSKSNNPNWGNLVFIKPPLFWLFGIYTRIYIKKYIFEE